MADNTQKPPQSWPTLQRILAMRHRLPSRFTFGNLIFYTFLAILGVLLFRAGIIRLLYADALFECGPIVGVASILGGLVFFFLIARGLFWKSQGQSKNDPNGASEAFCLDDPVVYRWTRKPMPSRRFSVTILPVTIRYLLTLQIPSLFFLACYWLVSLLSLSVATWGWRLWVAILLPGVAIALIKQWRSEGVAQKRARRIVCVAASFLLWCFPPILSSPANGLQGSFVGGSDASLFEWIFFTVNIQINVPLVHIPQSLGLNLTGLTPADAYGRAVLSVMQFLVALAIVEVVTDIVQRRYASEEFTGTVAECLIYCDSVPFGFCEEVLITCEGKLADLQQPITFQVSAFMKIREKSSNKPSTTGK